MLSLKRIYKTWSAGHLKMYSFTHTLLTRYPSAGVWGVGVASRDVCLDKAPLGTDSRSWLLRHDGSCWHANEPLATLSIVPSEGDIIVSNLYLISLQQETASSILLHVIQLHPVSSLCSLTIFFPGGYIWPRAAPILRERQVSRRLCGLQSTHARIPRILR